MRKECVTLSAGLQLDLWRTSPILKACFQETSDTANVCTASGSEMLSRSKQKPQQYTGQCVVFIYVCKHTLVIYMYFIYACIYFFLYVITPLTIQ